MQSNMEEKNNEAVCIIGMHRSGTSMIARLLNLCGLDLGPPEQLMEPSETNPMGYFENVSFTYEIDDALLAHLGGSWDNPPLFKEGWEYDASLEQIVLKAKDQMKIFSNSPTWGWKDPRATILLPFWKLLIPDLRFVICVRSPLEIAKSLARRDKFSMQKGLLLWNQYMQAAIRDTEGCLRIFTFYEDFFNDWAREISKLVEFCGLQRPNDLSKLHETIFHELRHHTCETFELLNEDKLTTEHKLFYIGLRALTTEGFVPSTSDRRPENLISENISKFSRLLERFHHEEPRAQLESVLISKDQQINNFSITIKLQQQSLADKEQHVAQLQQSLADKEQHVAQLQQSLADKEQHVAQLQQLLADKEQHVAQLAEALGEQKQQENLLTDEIERLTERVGQLRVVVNDKQKTVEEMAMEKESLYQFWLDANSSIGWRLIAKFRSLEARVMPVGTFRRSTYELFWKSIKTITFQGWSMFVLKTKEKLKEFKNPSRAIKESKEITFEDDIGLRDIIVTVSEEDEWILVIDRFVPTYDKDSGSLRMYSMLRILNEIGFKVAFLPDDCKKTEPYSSELHQIGITILDATVDFEKYLQKIGHIFTFVILSRPEIAFKYIPYIRAYAINSSIIYDTVDLHWLRLKRAATVSGKEALLHEANHYKSMELFNSACSDTVFTVTEDEKELLLKEIPELKVEVVPNVHDVVKVDRTFEERKNIMFIGGFFHRPNEDAVIYFIREILPIVKNKIEDMKFFIIGSNPPKSIQQLHSEDILVTGYVKDVTPYFKNCRVFVAPLRYGSGMKGKIGQSMACGLPVVTTKIGAEGMGLVDGENALITDEPKGFADAVARLYTDELLWNKISIQSIEHIEKNYSKEIISKKLAEIFHSIQEHQLHDEMSLKFGDVLDAG